MPHSAGARLSGRCLIGLLARPFRATSASAMPSTREYLGERLGPDAARSLTGLGAAASLAVHLALAANGWLMVSALTSWTRVGGGCSKTLRRIPSSGQHRPRPVQTLLHGHAGMHTRVAA